MSADPISAPTISGVSTDDFLKDVIAGLSRGPDEKSISSRYLYDERGCELFDEICQTPEYYPTRTETGIMQRDAAAMAQVCGPHCRLIELGSGSSNKTQLLLDELVEPAMYVPVDIAPDYLRPSVRKLGDRYPNLTIEPVCANFAEPFEVPHVEEIGRTVVYFPGSTIGNFHRPNAVKLLARMRKHCGSDGGILIGMDLKKDSQLIETAYNDRAGVTADFSANVLTRLQSELNAKLQADQFEHLARYNSELGRIEMYLCSSEEQQIRIGDHVFEIDAGELINTEYSYKYSLADVQSLAYDASFALTHGWLDARNWFGVFFFS